MYVFLPILCAGAFLLFSSAIVKNAGNFLSLLLVKLIPGGLGVWLLFVAATLQVSGQGF